MLVSFLERLELIGVSCLSHNKAKLAGLADKPSRILPKSTIFSKSDDKKREEM